LNNKKGFILNLTILFGFAIASWVSIITLYIMNGSQLTKLSKNTININLAVDFIKSSAKGRVNPSCTTTSGDACDLDFGTIAYPVQIFNFAKSIHGNIEAYSPYIFNSNSLKVTTASSITIPIDTNIAEEDRLSYFFLSTYSANECKSFLDLYPVFDTIGIKFSNTEHVANDIRIGVLKSDFDVFPNAQFRTAFSACGSVDPTNMIWIGVKV